MQIVAFLEPEDISRLCFYLRKKSIAAATVYANMLAQKKRRKRELQLQFKSMRKKLVKMLVNDTEETTNIPRYKWERWDREYKNSTFALFARQFGGVELGMTPHKLLGNRSASY